MGSNLRLLDTPTVIGVRHSIRPNRILELRGLDDNLVWIPTIADESVETRSGSDDGAGIRWVKDEVAAREEDFAWGRAGGCCTERGRSVINGFGGRHYSKV